MCHSISVDLLTDRITEVEMWTDTYIACGSARHKEVLKPLIESQIMLIRDSGAMTEAFHLSVRLGESN